MADMNLTPARPGLTPIIWDSDFFTEYVRKNQFARYMGTTMGSLIQVREDLTRKRGDTIVFPTVRRLVGAGVTGNTVLEGNEEVLNARSLNLSVAAIRHAVAVSDWDEQKSVIALRDAARDALMNWSLEKLRADIIVSLESVTADGSVQIPFSTATAAQRNYWMVNNADRMLFGVSKSNAVSGVMATALLTLDAPTDKMSAAIVTLAKRIARTANPHIRPISVNDDEEWFVMFMPSLPFRDLMQDPAIISGLQYAWERGKDNPLFTAGDIMWNGVIIKEVPEMPVIAGAGAAGVDVAMSALCGAQALGVAWAQRTKSPQRTRAIMPSCMAVGLQEMRGIGKLRFGVDPTVDTTKPVDAGVVSIFTTAVADA